MEYTPFIILVSIFGLVIGTYVFKSKKIVSVPLVLPSEGFSVPIINAYVGSLLFNMHNGLWPSLKLFEDHFDYVILWKKSVEYSVIQEVGVRTGFWAGGNTFVVKFNNGSWDYCASCNKHNLKEVLNFFQSKNIRLTEEAKRLLENNQII